MALNRYPRRAKLIGALQIKEPKRAADPGHGAQIYAQSCAACHSRDGLGQRAQDGAGYQFPPLWGPDSFNNGAGMSRLLTAAAYAMHNMPIGTTFDAPVLSDEDAYDVAAHIISQNRPQKANLDRGTSRSGSKNQSIRHMAHMLTVSHRNSTHSVRSARSAPRSGN